MSYTHLTQKEKYYFLVHLSNGLSQQEIVEKLGRHKSTICREIQRNNQNSLLVSTS